MKYAWASYDDRDGAANYGKAADVNIDDERNGKARYLFGIEI